MVPAARRPARDAPAADGGASGHAEVVKKARRALHPVDNIVHGAERQVITSLRSGRKRRRKGGAQVYRHEVGLAIADWLERG